MKIDFVGPSYERKTRKADPQRSINLYVSNVESGQGKNKHFLKSIPGLYQFSPPPTVYVFTLDKTQSADTGTVGDAQVYTIVLTNPGPHSADGARIVDVLPDAFTFTSCTIAYVGATGPATRDEAGLLAGFAVTTWPVDGTVTLTITGTFNTSGTVLNTATVSLGSDSATDSVTATVVEPEGAPGAFDPSFLRAGSFWALTDDNTTATFTDPSGSPGLAGNDNVRSLNGRTDKRYFEFVYAQQHGTNGQIIVGCGPAAFALSTKVGYNTANPLVWSVGYDNFGQALQNGGVVDTLDTWVADGTDVIGMAVDPSNGHVWWSLNGVWNGDPAGGSGYSATAPVGELFVMVGGDNVNFTASPLILYQGTGYFTAATQTYAAPTGFTPWDD